MNEDFLADAVFYTDPEDGKRRLGRFTPICDFCCGEPETAPIKWSYPAGEMEIRLPGSPISASDDSWGACEVCHDLIERGEWEALARRNLETNDYRFDTGYSQLSERLQKQAREQIVAHFRAFNEVREGPAVPEDEFDDRTGERKKDG